MDLKRLSAALLALVTAASALAGCGKGNKKEEGEAVPRTEILTGVYRADLYPLPEGYETDSRSAVAYDPASDTVTCVANGYFPGEEEEDFRLETCLLTLGKDGVKEQTPITFGEDENTYVQRCVFDGDTAYFLAESYDMEKGESNLFLVRQKDGESERIDDLARFFPNGSEDGWFYVSHFCLDGAGNLYLASEQQIAVLKPDLTELTAISTGNWIDTMASAPDGTVWISGWFGESRGMAPLDLSASSVGKSVSLPDNGNFFYGPGFDLYLKTDAGICGLTRTDEGYESETLLDFVNSNVSPDDAELVSVVDRDTFVMLERDYGSEDYSQSVAVYRHAEDVDLSKLTVIELAYGDAGIGYGLPAKVVAFNKAHPDIRIVVKDYGSYRTDEDWTAGSKKLATDMAAGLYHPDIVAGSAGDGALEVLKTKKLYADLSPHMDKDGTVNRENLFGAALSAFSDGNAVWTLGGNLSMQALLSTKEILGKYAGNDGKWSVGDFVSFAESLPKGVLLAEGLCQEYAAQLLGGGGYGDGFIDEENGKCFFDGEEFVSWLSYLVSLPKTYEEYAANNEIENTDWNDRYRFYHEGKIALRSEYFWGLNDFMGLEAAFGTKDYVIMGYPTAGGEGTGLLVGSDLLCSVTKWCEHPDAAWEVVKSFADGSADGRYGGRDGLPALKSLFDKRAEEYYDYEFRFYYDGSASWGTKSEEGEDSGMAAPEDDRPHILTYFTEEDCARIREFLDRPARLAGGTANEEISAIVNEEISALSGGVSTPEDCAKKIQSRVSIWLAEHQ